MEAKDTVIKQKVNWVAFNQANLEKLLLEQAEISFKAGEKKVVEWLKGYQAENQSFYQMGEEKYYPNGVKIPEKDWWDFLKSEGIE